VTKSPRFVVKLGLLGSLYFAQGLPFGFFTQALPVLLRQEGLSLRQVGLTSLLALPWALKFVWAPAVDRFSLRGIGHYQSWIVPLELLGAATLFALASQAGLVHVHVLMAAFFFLNLIAATQDIATDGLAVAMLEDRERGLANGLQVAGYRVGMIVGGGALLILHERLGHRGTFLAMALLLHASTVPVALFREPERARRGRDNPSSAPHFLRRAGAFKLILLLVTYKSGDAFATSMLRPFLADSGLDLGDIGWLLGTVGFVAGLLGAIAGGALVNRLGRRPALLTFGLLQACAIAGYAAVAFHAPARSTLALVCAAEHFASGMATAALFTCMMDWCSRETSATDYAVQASAVVIATGAAGALAGFSADALGYAWHFALGTVLALASLVAVSSWFPSRALERSVRLEVEEAVRCV
jgi:PAT family beta-lactamase induction signal transducer AmpG